jgi:hypothetical protein
MTDLPDTVTVEEQAQAAGRKPQGILPVGAYPDLDEFRDRVMGFLQSQPHADGSVPLMMAKSKAGELDYWLRAHRNRLNQ